MEIALGLIKKYEGFSNKAYFCPGGYKTIGYGHRILKGENIDENIDSEFAEELLLADIRKTKLAISRLIKINLSQAKEAALLSFTFNLGAGALQRSTLRRKINENPDQDLKSEFLRWIYINGRKSRGLLKRRKEEYHYYSEFYE